MTLDSDDASVMTGRLNEVGARLMKNQSQNMMQLNCVAHRLASAAGQVCRDS